MTSGFKLNVLALGTVAALLAGCATSGYKQADKTGEGIAEFRNEVVKARQAVDAAMVSLSRISETATNNPRKAYDAFAKSVERVEAARASSGKRAAEMKATGREYFREWDKQLVEINNPEIRKLAQQRKAQLSDDFDKVGPLVQKAKADFDPFYSDLTDLRTFLANDLTVTGIDSAKGIMKKTRADGTKLQESLDDLIAEMNGISATLTPAKAAK